MLTKGQNFRTQMNSQKTRRIFGTRKRKKKFEILHLQFFSPAAEEIFWVITSFTLLNPFPRSFRGLGHNTPESSCCISTCNAIQQRGCQSSCWCLLSHLCSVTPKTLLLIYIHGILNHCKKLQKETNAHKQNS